MGHPDSITYHSWPACDEKYTREDIIEVPVQINGRLRGRLVVSAAAGNEELQNSALADARVRKHIGDGVVKKVIVIPKKLINIVISK